MNKFIKTGISIAAAVAITASASAMALAANSWVTSTMTVK